jgi:hypothetical protein
LAWRLAAFTRRRTEGAGGFFGIERMSKRTILAGGEGGVAVDIIGESKTRRPP